MCTTILDRIDRFGVAPTMSGHLFITKGIPMHAVLITFETEAPRADVAVPFAEYAEALRQQPGFISKCWIDTAAGFGGFHLFTDRASADAYLESPLAAGLMGTEGFRHFDVEHFDVLDELSAMTGVPA